MELELLEFHNWEDECSKLNGPLKIEVIFDTPFAKIASLFGMVVQTSTQSDKKGLGRVLKFPFPTLLWDASRFLLLKLNELLAFSVAPEHIF